MTDKKQTKARRVKMATEMGSQPTVLPEDSAIKEKKTLNYTQEHLVQAIFDLSKHINNAYFKTPFNRCPDCNNGNGSIMAHFGISGSDTIGNLKGFSAIVGDVIAWSSDTYKGLSIVKSKSNGIYTLETSNFPESRNELAIIERMIVPSKYRPILAEMAEHICSGVELELNKSADIGGRLYPNAIAKKL